MPAIAPTCAEVASLLRLALAHHDDPEISACLEAVLSWLERQVPAPAVKARPALARQSDWLTRAEAAEYLKLSKQHLANLASVGKGPKFRKTSPKHVLYHIEDLNEHVRTNGSARRRR